MNINSDESTEISSAIPYCKLPEWYYILMRALEKELENDAHEKVWTTAPLPKVYIPLLSETLESTAQPIGVIGGYFYQSDRGDKRLKERAWPYQDLRYAPIVQINLDILSQLTGTKFGSGILQVWGTDYAWGDYDNGPVSAEFDIIKTKDIINRREKTCIPIDLDWFTKQPERTFYPTDLDRFRDSNQKEEKLINFHPTESLQYACFDWTDSTYANDLGLNAPIFITGIDDAGLNCQTERKMQQKSLIKKLRELNLDSSELKKLKEIFKKGPWSLSALIHIQRNHMETSFGNFEAGNLSRFSKINWLPLMTLNGPMGDSTDFYTIFYSPNKDGSIKYKVSASRNDRW